jgi:hypothetical protein
MVKRIVATSAVAWVAALVFLPAIGTPPASAQQYVMRKFRAPKDIPDSLRASLDDKVSEDAGPYLDKEHQNKMSGKPYTDFVPKFEYLPNYGPGGELSTVSVKLGGAEYDPKSKTTTKGVATGKLKYLVFSYSRHGSNWVRLSQPKWESQDLGKEAGQEMTKHQQVGDRNKAIIAKQQEKKKSLANALQKKFGNQ